MKWISRAGRREQLLLGLAAVCVFALGVLLGTTGRAALLIFVGLPMFFLSTLLVWAVFAISYAHHQAAWSTEEIDFNKEIKAYGGNLITLATLGLAILSWHDLIKSPHGFDLMLKGIVFVTSCAYLLLISRYSPLRRPLLVLNNQGIRSLTKFVPWSDVEAIGGQTGSSFGGYMSSLWLWKKNSGPTAYQNPSSKLVFPLGGAHIPPGRLVSLAQKYLEEARKIK